MKHLPPPTKFGLSPTGQAKQAGPSPTRHQNVAPAHVTPPRPAWGNQRAAQRMEATIAPLGLSFFAQKGGNLSANDPIRFQRIKGSAKACQSIAIGGVLGCEPVRILRDLILCARRLRRGLRRHEEGIVNDTQTVNATLSGNGFDMADEGAEGFVDYDYASETVIVSYMVKRGFKEVTATVLHNTRGMYVATFCAQAPVGRYVLMTSGHAIGIIVAGVGNARAVRYFDGDGADGQLADGSRQKRIISVFSPA